MIMQDLISDDYLESQKWLHAQPRGYGGRGNKWAQLVTELASEREIKTIVDYGCGQGTLGKALREQGFFVRDYDPAVPDFAALPCPADMVVCTDVLEHIERDKLENVLTHLTEVCQGYLFAVISLVETDKKLPDGRSAHILIEKASWWMKQLISHNLHMVEMFPGKPGKEHKEFIALFVKEIRE
jgi:2-polyprenyl-3-methyl-5-hydroxy-6-metoxy-1,4-benzoquinol methylase